MTSDRKRRANRQNAKRSTGPRTRAGKARSSRNSFRHGLAHDDTSQDDVMAWIETAALVIADPDADDPVLLSAAREIAAAQHQLYRVQKAQLAVLDSERHPRMRHRLRPSAAERMLLEVALEPRFIGNGPADGKAEYRSFAAWPGAMRLALALMIRRLTDADSVKQHWIESLVSELKKIERYHQRASSRRLKAVMKFEALKASKSALDLGLHSNKKRISS